MTSPEDPTGHSDESTPAPAATCPLCGAGFTDREPLAAHLLDDHRLARVRRHRPSRLFSTTGEPQPALGRERRSPVARRLRQIPLWLVMTLNVVAILLAMTALDAAAPPWWVAFVEQRWSRFALIVALWPTVGFLILRGID